MTSVWTPVALIHDLPPGGVIGTTCGAVDIAVWRSAAGRMAAWVDRCPHRGTRLSHGFVRGEMLSCIYHGWRFDGEAQCRKIPAHPDLAPPPTIRATALACTVSDDVVWVAETPPAAPPPDLSGLVALRSLTVETDAATLGRALGGEGDRLMWRIAGDDRRPALALLGQPLAPGRTALHSLAMPGPAAALIAASRWLEDLRRRAEMQEAFA